jgi:hypothetical protein
MLIDLYIQIRDGRPFEHPIVGENLRAARPDIDCGNLPPDFAYFLRVPRPTIGKYQIFESPYPTYEWMNDKIVHDVWHVRDMTEEEKATLNK